MNYMQNLIQLRENISPPTGRGHHEQVHYSAAPVLLPDRKRMGGHCPTARRPPGPLRSGQGRYAVGHFRQVPQGSLDVAQSLEDEPRANPEPASHLSRRRDRARPQRWRSATAPAARNREARTGRARGRTGQESHPHHCAQRNRSFPQPAAGGGRRHAERVAQGPRGPRQPCLHRHRYQLLRRQDRRRRRQQLASVPARSPADGSRQQGSAGNRSHLPG